MNEPHENLDPDPFAHDAARRPSRLRRAIVRHERPGACGAKAGDGLVRPLARRQVARARARTATRSAEA